MSRLTRHLKQTAKFEAAVRDENGEVVLDVYGKYSYDSPVQLPCRREASVEKVSTGFGVYVQNGLTYYVDERQKIRVNDKLDGNYVRSVIDYVDGAGVLVGYEVHT